EFFFDNIPTEEIDSKSLNIEVWHQANQKLQKDALIGEICVPLKDLTQLYSKKEVRIVEELKHRMSSKKLGKLYITTCIEKEARRLTINLLKVDDLPKCGFMGAPDVCVRVTLSQASGAPTTKSSRVLKNTCTAVYKEAIMFLISTKEADLLRTKITINVHDLTRSATGDDVIGSAYLGELAVDKSEIEQWKNTMDHWGKEYKACHSLKSQNQNAPDVHVSEAQSDSEE
uniref:C2 domain-containing protein n=1 Tax=Acrobeloides nanus TaxID=290746 RepID=A0A914CWX5_9BILA